MSYDPSAKAGGNPTTVTATRKLLALDDSGNFADVTAADILAWVNTQVTDLSKSTVLSSLPNDFQALGVTGGGFALAPKSLLGTASSSSGSTTTGAASTFTVALSSASGTLGSTTTMTVTPGSGGWPSGVTVTPSVSGVSGSFSPASATPSGTMAATFTFTSSAAGTGTLNASVTGMTSNGGQTYTATAAANSSPASTALAFSKAAGYGTGKFGQGLTAGTATYDFDIPANGNSNYPTMANANVEFFIKTSGTGFVSQIAFLKIVDSAGTEFGLRRQADNLYSTYGAGDYATGKMDDAAFHHVRLNIVSDYSQQNYTTVMLDGGGNQQIEFNATPCLKSGRARLTIDFDQLGSGAVLDEIRITSNKNTSSVPTAAYTTDSSTLLLLHLDGNGNAS